MAQLKGARARRQELITIPAIKWTDHTGILNSLEAPDLNPMVLRWIAGITSDGSEIRSLSRRSARIPDAFSRNVPGRDELLDQRSSELRGLLETVRGFDLESYADDEHGGAVEAWALCGPTGYGEPEVVVVAASEAARPGRVAWE